MATAVQVLANRENAQLSTGPTSEEGKAKAAQNAVRHHLTARGLIVPLGMEDDFALLEAGLLEHLMPLGDLQNLLFKRILECAWNVERCRRAEGDLFAPAEDKGIAPLLDQNEDPRYARIQKYARQNENSMLKLMRELGRLSDRSPIPRRNAPAYRGREKRPREIRSHPARPLPGGVLRPLCRRGRVAVAFGDARTQDPFSNPWLKSTEVRAQFLVPCKGKFGAVVS